MVSIIIPSRNERFLQKTVEDILEKAKGEVEVIVILDGYWPDSKEIVNDPRVHYIHRGRARGLRDGVSSAVAIARGKYIMKIDAHCMFDEGFDVKLAADCKPDWVVVPRRYSLDPENWCWKDKGPIDYLHIECPADNNNGDLCGKVWKYPEGKDKLIDDLMTFQGSCWFMEREYFYKLGPFDEENYGTFRKEPQEIGFKCWLSGGRVIRNKKTWYAHLHKGRKYGRGYRASKSDWVKGDEYNKRWLTNSAWDERQTKDFKWLVEKFSPPGWEDFDWSGHKEFIAGKKVVKEEKKVKLYQNIGEKEGEFLWQNPKKKHSRFWNEGKWENFIEPLLPKDCQDQTFVEVGCNAGLFLKLAKEKGFRNVVGVEKDNSVCKEGIRYRNSLGLDYKILNRAIGTDFDFDELPVADFTLLSTVHYYFDISEWLKYLDKLQYKTRYCLIVSRPLGRVKHWRPGGEIEEIRNYFRGWDEVEAICDVSKKGDPHPRDMWSLLFRSKLKRRKVDGLYTKNEKHGTWKKDYIEMDAAKKELTREISQNDEVKMEDTGYFKQWMERKKGSWSEEEVRKFVQGKIDLMFDVKRNGLKEPLLVKLSGQICDGGHRLAILKALGYKSVIVRVI